MFAECVRKRRHGVASESSRRWGWSQRLSRGRGRVLTEAEGDQAPGGQARGGVSWVRKKDRATARRLGGVEGKIIPGNK